MGQDEILVSVAIAAVLGGIEGLTTAASLLVVAAIGVAVAVDQLMIAGGGTLLALAILRVAMYLKQCGSSNDDRIG
jgi:uncharacterized membrane protein YhiD involved in acid resistance